MKIKQSFPHLKPELVGELWLFFLQSSLTFDVVVSDNPTLLDAEQKEEYKILLDEILWNYTLFNLYSLKQSLIQYFKTINITNTNFIHLAMLDDYVDQKYHEQEE